MQSLIKKKTHHLKNDSDSDKNCTVHVKEAKMSWPASTTIIYNNSV
jgi:hypothetical protein